MADYYNDGPIGVSVIDNLNSEYNLLEEENNSLILELKKYQIPNIIYKSYNEFNSLKTQVLDELKNFLIDLTKTNKFLIFYNEFKCPESLKNKLIECFKILLKSNENNDYNLPWIINTSNIIIKNIDIFLQSMTLYPCTVISNETYLVNIIFENIRLQIKEYSHKIPLIKCNTCCTYSNIVDNENICNNCFISN